LYIFGVLNIYGLIVPIEYSAGISIVVIVSVAYSIDGVTKLINAIFISNGNHNIYIVTTVAAGGGNIILNYFLIPRYGYMGAAYATLLSFLLAFFLTVCFFVSMKRKV